MSPPVFDSAYALDGFIAAFFVLFSLGVVVARQMRGALFLFMLHAVALTASAIVLAITLDSPHLGWVALITFATKVVAVPLVLRWTAGRAIHQRREVDQVLTITSSLLIAAMLALIAWVTVEPLVDAIANRPFAAINLPSGLISIFFGAFTVTVRREAVVQLMGLLVMESGAFFASISIVNDLSVIAEISAAVDVPIAALVIGLLMRYINRATHHTRVGHMSRLKENP